MKKIFLILIPVIILCTACIAGSSPAGTYYTYLTEDNIDLMRKAEYIRQLSPEQQEEYFKSLQNVYIRLNNDNTFLHHVPEPSSNNYENGVQKFIDLSGTYTVNDYTVSLTCNENDLQNYFDLLTSGGSHEDFTFEEIKRQLRQTEYVIDNDYTTLSRKQSDEIYKKRP